VDFFDGAGTTISINGTQASRRMPDEGHGAELALDPRTGEKKWEFKMTDVTDAGIPRIDRSQADGRLLLRARCSHQGAAVEDAGGRHRAGTRSAVGNTCRLPRGTRCTHTRFGSRCHSARPAPGPGVMG
jgi:hypothetical protein